MKKITKIILSASVISLIASVAYADVFIVPQGGTGSGSFTQGWVNSDGLNGGGDALTASTSPTVNYITATSTTATSTFDGGISAFGIQATRALYISNGSTLADQHYIYLGTDILQDSTSNVGSTGSVLTTVGGSEDLWSQNLSLTGTIQGSSFTSTSNNASSTFNYSVISPCFANFSGGPCLSNFSLSGGGLNALTYWTGSGSIGATSSPTAGFYIATSTTHSTFPYASSTAITVSGTASTTNLITQTASTSALTASNSIYDTLLNQGWLYTLGGVNPIQSSTSPTVNYIVATSTTSHSVIPFASSTALTISGTASTTNLVISGLKKGSVPFAGTAGLISQDNSNLFWDASNLRLGIGTNAPQMALQAGNVTSGTFNYVAMRGDQFGGSIGGSGAANEATIGGLYTTNPLFGSAIAFGAQGSLGQRGGIAFLTKNTDDNTTQPSVQGVVTADGLWGLGSQTNPQTLLDVAGDITDENVQNCNGPSSALGTDDNGVLYCESGISDASLKTDETPLSPTATLQAILTLNPISYRYTPAYVASKQGQLQDLSTSTEMVGFVAQDVQKVFPDVVSTTTVRLTASTTKKVLTIDYQHLSVYLFAAIKAEQAKIDDFSAEIDAINNRLTAAGIK